MSSREEILSMTVGRDLNMLIAEKVMGWEYGEDYFESMGKIKRGSLSDTFDPSAEMSDAWEVVEKMRTEHKQFITIIDNPHLNYDVRFSGSKSKEYHRLSSLPWAICRASLLAVME